MKIDNVNNTGAPAFKDLHMKKKVRLFWDSVYSKDRLLAHGNDEFKKAVKNFEVKVKQNKISKILLPSTLFSAAGISAATGVITNNIFPFVLSGALILANMIRSLQCYDYKCKIEVGEEAKKGILGNTKIKGNKLKYETDLWPAYEYFYSDLVKKIVDTSPSSKIRDYILNGKIDLAHKSCNHCLEKLTPEDRRAVKDFYSKKMLTPDKDGNLPLHLCKDGLKAASYLGVFVDLDDIETIIKINLTKNKKGELPVHQGNKDTLLYLLRYNPEVLSEVLTTKNDDTNRCLLDEDEKYHQAYYETIKNEESYKNWAKNQKSRFLEKNYTFNNQDGKKIFEILNYLLGDIKPEEKSLLIFKLKSADKFMDYNLKDENGITPLEIILNSEDKELLELLKDKSFVYYPELDYVYDGITNPEFKSEAGKLNLKFNDIEEAIRLSSREAIDKLEPQFKSRFFNENISKSIFEQAYKMEDKTVKAYFFAKYINYMPDYAEKMLLYGTK